MALAIHIQELVDRGEVGNYADLARLAHVTARMTQVMSLLLLAPDIQEELLFLPLSNGGHDPTREMRPWARFPHHLSAGKQHFREELFCGPSEGDSALW